jgi:hypothetical protein
MYRSGHGVEQVEVAARPRTDLGQGVLAVQVVSQQHGHLLRQPEVGVQRQLEGVVQQVRQQVLQQRACLVQGGVTVGLQQVQVLVDVQHEVQAHQLESGRRLAQSAPAGLDSQGDSAGHLPPKRVKGMLAED